MGIFNSLKRMAESTVKREVGKPWITKTGRCFM